MFLMGKATQNYTKGFFRLSINDNDEYELVEVSSLTGNKNGSDGMNVELILITSKSLRDIKDYVKKSKMRKAIWIGRDDYIMPKDIGQFIGILRLH